MTNVSEINSAVKQMNDIIDAMKGDMSSILTPVSNVDLGSAQAKVSSSSIDQVKEFLSNNQNERG